MLNSSKNATFSKDDAQVLSIIKKAQNILPGELSGEHIILLSCTHPNSSNTGSLFFSLQ